MPDRNYQQILIQKFPTHSIGGQCGVFMHQLAMFPPIGNPLSDKLTNFAKYGYLIAELECGPAVGDIILTNESKTYGHVAFVNSIINGNLVLTESNYHLDEKVEHFRQIPRHSPAILAVIRAVPTFIS